MFKEECLEKKEIFRGKLLNLREDVVKLNDGKTATREFVKSFDASAVVAIDENQKIVLVNQFRYAQKKEMLEIPAGGLNQFETPLDAAKRELLEETGYASNSWKDLGEIVPSLHCTQKIYIFLAENAYFKTDPHPDEGELLEVLHVPFKDVLNYVLYGKIKDSKTIIAILKYYNIFKAV